jgi:predicted porin
MYAGVVNGFSRSYFDTQTSYYLGATIATPITGLRLGGSFDYLDVGDNAGFVDEGNAWAAALYASYQMTEKLSLHGRAEYLDDQADFFGGPAGTGFKVWAFTGTVQYDLWKNVLSRLEFRWDHSDSGKLFGSNTSVGLIPPTRKNAYVVILNAVYKF